MCIMFEIGAKIVCQVRRILLSRFKDQWIHQCFHQSKILWIFLTNICYDFFFNWPTEKKTCFGPIRNFFSFQLLKLRKLMTKICKQIGGSIWWIYKRRKMNTITKKKVKLFREQFQKCTVHIEMSLLLSKHSSKYLI